MVTVDNDDICAAIKSGFEDTRCVLEPAGALAVAGVAKHARTLDLESDKPCFVAAAGRAL